MGLGLTWTHRHLPLVFHNETYEFISTSNFPLFHSDFKKSTSSRFLLHLLDFSGGSHLREGSVLSDRSGVMKNDRFIGVITIRGGIKNIQPLD